MEINMKRLLLFTCILLFMLCGCKNKNKNNQIAQIFAEKIDQFDMFCKMIEKMYPFRF